MKKIILLCTVVFTTAVATAQVSWTEQNSAFTVPSTGINNLSIVDATTAWGVGYDGSATPANYQTFTKTSNSGTSWTSGAINLGNSALLISDISAVSATTAWTIATPETGGAGGGVWKTTDGGANWAKQTTATFNLSASFPNVVHFFDANNGFCQGDPTGTLFEIYTTSNGGTTWTKLTSASVPAVQNANEYGYVHSKAYAGDNAWFGTSTGRLYKTANKGATWSVVSTPISDFGGTASSGTFAIKDANNGWILASSGVVYKTIDGGTTWTTGSTLTQTNAITYVPGTTGTLIAVGNGTGSSISYNGGTTWTSIENTNSYVSVRALNSATVWAGSFNTSAFAGGVYKLSALLATKENQISNGMSIFPNPTSDILNIKTDEKIKSVEIFDMVGRKINAELIDNKINVKELEAGSYILSVETAKGKSTEKFIKK
ncbi:T9SS type A sorting domain-containing protein [Frigoriflavimonas asaccharolytica]|uniref:Photosystem II stability/assembly factor-like uncharacterized protein n=1 Tax=Frigoriflavimonas asaccharolytica TaxID=2735899 RepID=A0A8J8G6A8_9FLAO|nr:T9SS type A sorting domain-containing protein [Frigoriflavimonas asaccharolytica]NRS91928.1 photosystem II stability/assembly factor-like uncharacterized protein [Frigoriflavimonas asaccharolytica]